MFSILFTRQAYPICNGASHERDPLLGRNPLPRPSLRSPLIYAPGNAQGRFVSEDILHPGREAGSIRVGIRKGMRGYVAPRPGTAEDAAVKRLAIKGATGVVAKVC